MYIVEKIKKIIAIEKVRYRKKGLFNTVLSLVLLFGLMKLALLVGEAVWPDHIQDKRRFVFIWAFIIHTVIQFVSFFLYLPGYLGLSAFHKAQEINTRSSWPWERKDWKEVLTKSVKNFVLNQLLLYPLMVYFNRANNRFTDFPTMTEVIPQYVMIYFTEDFFSYWSHRILHHPKLYKIHKKHHQYDKVFSLVFEYTNPIEFVLHSILPSSLAFTIVGKITQLHCYTFFLWIIWKVMISTEGHSGYEIPWSPMRALPLISGASFHEHHHSSNVGNYSGSCILWDVMLETGDTYFQNYLKSKDQ